MKIKFQCVNSFPTPPFKEHSFILNSSCCLFVICTVLELEMFLVTYMVSHTIKMRLLNLSNGRKVHLILWFSVL